MPERALLSDFPDIPNGNLQYSTEFIESQGALKLGVRDGKTIVGITEKTSPSSISTLRNFHQNNIDLVLIDSVELSSFLSKRMGEVEQPRLAVKANDETVLLDKLANDAPTVNFVNSICIDGIRSGASDIHIEANVESAKVRYRIDGSLVTSKLFDPRRFPAISSRIKIMANLNILERRQPQDGRITVSVGKETVDLRVSIVPVSGGESIVLRILGKAVDAQTLEELGFNDAQASTLRRLIRMPHGLILITGPTGSGKTTTLNALLKEIVSESIKVITIEDPVEFILEGANQIQINEQIGLGFDSILRRVLRQDPNVIMIGEIRDSSTAELAVRAAMTGHLVLSTLHTNDSVSVIPRLINMGIEPYLLSSVLRGAVAQRLVRKLCSSCVTLNPASTQTGKKKRLTSPQSSKPAGCDVCNQLGYKGRTSISEIFCMDEELENLINAKARLNTISEHLRNKGMKSILDCGLEKVSMGITTINELEKELSFSGGVSS